MQTILRKHFFKSPVKKLVQFLFKKIPAVVALFTDTLTIIFTLTNLSRCADLYLAFGEKKTSE